MQPHWDHLCWRYFEPEVRPQIGDAGHSPGKTGVFQVPAKTAPDVEGRRSM